MEERGPRHCVTLRELPSPPPSSPGTRASLIAGEGKKGRNREQYQHKARQTKGASARRQGRIDVRGNVDHRECESQGLSRFTALFVEVGAKQSIA